MAYNFDLATPLNYGIQKREEEASHDIFHSIARMAGGALVGLISGGPIGMAAGGAAALSSEMLGPEAGAVVGAAVSKFGHRNDAAKPTAPKGWSPDMTPNSGPQIPEATMPFQGPQQPRIAPFQPGYDPMQQYRESLRRRMLEGGQALPLGGRY